MHGGDDREAKVESVSVVAVAPYQPLVEIVATSVFYEILGIELALMIV